MLWFVGAGISGTDSMSVRASKVVRTADMVYVETFTSPGMDKDTIESVGQIREAPRWLVEDGKQILADAATYDNVVLLSYGDPMIATTHTELRVRAVSENIQVSVLHASSAISGVISECGLHHYKAGRMATIMNDTKSLQTPYNTTYQNAIRRNHTLLLLEYDSESGFFLDPTVALKMMSRYESGRRRGVFDESVYAIVASRIGQSDQRIRAGYLKSLIRTDFGKPPHSIVIPARLHFTERDALMALVECVDEPPPEDKDPVTPISEQMLSRYIPMIQEAINSQANNVSSGIADIIQNAEAYMQDAQRALDEDRWEVAILLTGYADGLVDALRIMQGKDPKM